MGAAATTLGSDKAAARRIAQAVRRADGQLLRGGTEAKGTGNGAAKRPTSPHGPPGGAVTTARAVWLAAGVVNVAAAVGPVGPTGGKKRRKRGNKPAAAAQAAANRLRARGNAAVYPAAFPQPDLPPSLVRGRVGLAEALHRTIATRDPNDQAHTERDEDGLLLPAREVGAQASPRRYPESHLNGRGVAIDSAFDELYERQKWLEREVGDVPGLSDARPVSASVQRAMGQAGSAKNLRVWLNGGRPR